MKILIALGNCLWSYTHFNIENTIIQYYLFFIISNTDIASYMDDNTPYITADNIDDLTKSLEEAYWMLKEQPW